MINQLLKFTFLALFFCVSTCVEAQLKGVLGKSFESLEVYNYFSAKDGFYKSFKKDPVPAGYGLSLIYSRSDNPFTNLDSSLKYISVAREMYTGLDEKRKAAYAAAGIDSASIHVQVYHVDSLAYAVALSKADTSVWVDYIQSHYTPGLLKKASLQLDSLAFAIAVEEHTSAAYQYFIDTYPEALQQDEARELLDLSIYEEMTVSGELDSYRLFIREHPENPYRERAEREIFQRFTKAGTPEVYLLFIEENEGNRFANEAWRNIYALEIGSMTPKAIAAFTLKYPDYPFIEELQQEFNLLATTFYPARTGGKWGFIDEKGVMRIEPAYDWCEPFSENLALVGKGDMANFIGKDGKELSESDFDEAYSFKNGYAAVEVGGKVGLMNRLGKWVLRPEYEECGEFSEGFAYASRDGQFGYVNSRGKAAIAFEFDEAGDFHNGRAIVQREGLQGAIDSLGNTVIDFVYDWIEPFQGHESSRVRKDGLYGLIGRDGKLIAPVQYANIGEFSEGYYLAAQAGKYGFITANADTAVDFIYDYDQTALLQSKFIGGFAKVYQKEKNVVKTGVIDTTGKKIVPAIFDDLLYASSGLIPVKKKNLWGYADKSLKLAIPYKYDIAEPFMDSLALVSFKGLYTLIDKEGKAMFNESYKYLKCLDSLCLVADTAYGLINREGLIRVPLEYKAAEIIDSNTILFEDFQGTQQYYHLTQQRFIWREDTP